MLYNIPHMTHDHQSTTWPDEIELELSGMAQGGAAVGRVAGRPVFAAGGLPGERVRVRLHERRAAFAHGTVTQVLRAAPARRASPCPNEALCGAADWRWIDDAAQREFKASILRDQLRHLGGLEVEVAPPVSVPAAQTWNYRISAELHVHERDIGYFRPGTRQVADPGSCCLHHPLINQALLALRPLLRDTVRLRTVTLRCSPATGETLALLDGEGELLELARAWRRACPGLVGVMHAPSRRVLQGRAWLEQQVAGLRFRVSADAFFQVNAAQTPRLVARVRELLAPTADARLLDLYCGVGLFALSLAPLVRDVVGIEAWSPAVSDARSNARLNRINHARFQAGPVERLLARLDGPFAYAVLDPPRRGCAPAALEALIALRPHRIVYVSCHPGTLARDCRRLAAAGYRPTHAEIIDMFPQTHHVESIVRLERDA